MLFGRTAECARVDELLAGARHSRGGTLVVRGSAGLGKTALLDYAASSPDVLVLRATGVQAESELAYASAHQLLRPLLPLIPALPAPQSNAVQVALGMADGGAPDRFLVALGFLSLLSEAGRERPVLCLLDDVQWCDDASIDALRFAERRLATDPVVFVFALRDEPGAEPFELPEAAEIVVTGLSDDAAGELLAATAGSAVADSVRSELLARTRGNPLALLELSRALSHDHLSGHERLPDPLPVGDRLGRAFLDRARWLSAEAQQLLLVAAAEESGDTDIVTAASGDATSAAMALVEVERSGLLTIRPSGLEFCHPLARSSIYGAATAAARRAVHAALADVLSQRGHVDRRTWHLAAAATGPDEDVARELEQLAHRASRRSGHSAAASALERAAELSPESQPRAVRLVAAAAAAWRAGRPDRATALLQRADAIVPDGRVRAELDHLRGVIAWRCGSVPYACSVLLSGAEAAARVDADKALEMLADAGLAAWDAGDYVKLAEIGRAAGALPGSQSAEHRYLADVLVGSVDLGLGSSAGDTPPLRAAIVRAADLDEPRLLVWAAIAAEVAGEGELEAEILARGVALGRESGAVDRLTVALEASAVQGLLTGRLDAATEATEGLTLARQAGLSNAASLHLATLAWLAAVQGHEDECRAHAAEVLAVARPNGHGIAVALAEWALGLLDLGLGRPEEAARQLTALRAASTSTGHPYYALNSAPDLVEACVRAGNSEAAISAFAVLDAFAGPGAPRWALALAARCRGLLADGPAATALFGEAARLHAEGGNPFDRARTLLVLGEGLRRQRQRSAAREHLRHAFETFDRMGARPWADRAAAELRATGETVQRDRTSGLDQLTPQELQIIRQVCRGATNREVAAQLFISPRTVEYHLYKAYPKLGISSRTQLIGKYGNDEELTLTP